MATPGARAAALVAAVVAAAVATAGCGDPVLTPSACDSPQLEIEGTITRPAGLTPPAHPALTLLWRDAVQETHHQMPAPPASIRAEILDDDSFTMKMFATPPPETIVPMIEKETNRLLARYSFGEIALYDDVDGDGVFDLPPDPHGTPAAPGSDPFRGGGTAYVVVYVWQPLTDPAIAVGDLFDQGPRYRLGLINCMFSQETQELRRVGDPSAVSIAVTMRNPSADLPFDRTCFFTAP